MAITRINRFEAKSGCEDTLFAFLENVISIVRSCPGSRSCQLLRSLENPAQLVIIEEWDTIEDHRNAASAVPPEQLRQASALFAVPPAGQNYQQ